MPVYYCPDCWFDDTDLDVLKDHMRTAHPERIDTTFAIKISVYLEKHRARKKHQ